ncbi:hypothetical protein [Actinokineospora bangkokensis]|uniref:SPOR domain-containing protein n=1 Tax=Actinokineospora bangkokensis TaxID=1193682 RepID=A0A1Q9LEC2_9PSEU|nr:hypothetical protein [Actinokineospora bangkokensis]OLR90353.1 hypothetical protein BJP25_04345 [Actinokineospora bangkokensis]
MFTKKKDPNPDEGWYYNTKTNQVEHGDVGKAIDRLGPYPDRASAERALETAHERTQAADQADKNWGSGA